MPSGLGFDERLRMVADDDSMRAARSLAGCHGPITPTELRPPCRIADTAVPYVLRIPAIRPSRDFSQRHAMWYAIGPLSSLA